MFEANQGGMETCLKYELQAEYTTCLKRTKVGWKPLPTTWGVRESQSFEANQGGMETNISQRAPVSPQECLKRTKVGWKRINHNSSPVSPLCLKRTKVGWKLIFTPFQ